MVSVPGFTIQVTRQTTSNTIIKVGSAQTVVLGVLVSLPFPCPSQCDDIIHDTNMGESGSESD